MRTIDPFTDEEHRARAMLLGWKYVRYAGYYVNMYEQDPTSVIPIAFRRYDAITMEPLDRAEVIIRTDAANNKRRWYAEG